MSATKKAKKTATKKSRDIATKKACDAIARNAAGVSPKRAYKFLATLTGLTPLEVQDAIESKLQAAAVTAYSELLQEWVPHD